MPSILESVDSTNHVLASMSIDSDGASVVADEQTAGRGRVDRSWVSTAGAGLWMSVLIRLDGVDRERWPLLSLAAALAARRAIADACDVSVGIKWPNDLVVEPTLRKLGGLLIEVSGSRAIVGIGINVAWAADRLPTPESTSILVEGGRTDRAELLAQLLVDLEELVSLWRASPDEIVTRYRQACVSLGREVIAHLPDGAVMGVATAVDDSGRLIISSGETSVFISAGDVIHATITPWDTPRSS